MSKYNNIKSIPIESIPKEEMAQAIKEWAEGDDAMERLLTTCYEKNIKTCGCHAGARPYIQFKYQDNIEKLTPLLETTLDEIDSQIFITADGGNPFSGEEWYLPSIGIGTNTKFKDEADPYFDRLTDSISNDNDSSNKLSSLLKLLDFFVGKESCFIFRLRHTKDNKYFFNIESREIPKERYNYYNELLSKLGFEERTLPDFVNPERHDWEMKSDNKEEFLNRVDSISDAIINSYSYDFPKSDDEIASFILRAQFKKRTLPENEFKDWIEEKKIELGYYDQINESEKQAELNSMLNNDNNSNGSDVAKTKSEEINTMLAETETTTNSSNAVQNTKSINSDN